MSPLRYWVGLWNQVEHPRSLALVRIALALILLVDLLEVAWLDLVIPIMGAEEAGGWPDPDAYKSPPLYYTLAAWTFGWADPGTAAGSTPAARTRCRAARRSRRPTAR